MMLILRKIILSAVVLLLTASLVSASVATANVYQVYRNPRGLAMGGLGCALSGDDGAVLLNPGNVIGLHGIGLTFGQRWDNVNRLVPDLTDDIYFEQVVLNATIPSFNGFTVGLSLIGSLLDYGPPVLPNQPASRERSESFGLSVDYEGRLAVGMRWSVWNPRVWFEPAHDHDTRDFGVTLRPIKDHGDIDLTLGYSLLNQGDDANNGDPMPETMRFGCTLAITEPWRIGGWGFERRIGIEREEMTVKGGQVVWHYGAELASRVLALRCGYLNDPDGDIQNWTWGVGLGYDFDELSMIRFDISNVPQATDLDRTWKGAFTMRFAY